MVYEGTELVVGSAPGEPLTICLMATSDPKKVSWVMEYAPQAMQSGGHLLTWRLDKHLVLE